MHLLVLAALAYGGTVCDNPTYGATLCNGNFSGSKCDLRKNQLSGTIPSQLSRLTQLQHLYLGRNRLSGSIPSQLSVLTQLQDLDLGKYLLSGTIPSQLSRLTQLQHLVLEVNHLSGTIPSQLSLLTRLQFLALNQNKLSGTISSQLSLLTQLQDLALSINKLSGTIPSQLSRLTQLQHLWLDQNQLRYTYAGVVALQQLCASAFCFGVPPDGCSAFADAVVSLSDPSTCVECSGNELLLLILLAAFMLGAAVALVLLVRFGLRRPQALKQGVSTVVIVYNHAQTLAIIGSIGLPWPRSIEAVMHLLSLNALRVPAVSCLLGDGQYPDVDPQDIFEHLAIIALASCIAIPLAILGYGAIARCRHQLDQADRSELLLSFVFSLQLVFSWNAMVACAAAGYVDEIGSIFLLPMCLLQLLLVVRFWRHVKHYACGLRDGTWRAPRCCGQGRPITPRRLAKQVAFLTGRFAPHAPRWQFAIWLRQVALFAVALIPKMVLYNEYNDGHSVRPAPSTDFRFVIAAAAAAITLIAWVLHRSTQPYAYRYQNALEAWLYAATVALLGLVCVYAPVPSDSPARIPLELIMLLVFLGSLVGGAAFSVRHARATTRALATIDLSAALAAAEAQLDGPIHERLLDGTIRLLRCDWIASSDADAKLGRDPVSGNALIRRRQDMPTEAYFSPEDAAALFRRGDRSVLVLSYGWHTGPHSDPSGLTLREVRRYLRSEPSTAGCALFWDIASRPQPEQTDAEAEVGHKALAVMSSFYASVTGTAVLQQKAVPPRPAEYDGAIQLFGVAEALREPAKLREDMATFGAIRDVEIVPVLVELHDGPGRRIARVKQANAIVRFATHAEAEAAVAGLREQKRGAALLYNSTPYEGEGGRGWCLVEQGASSVVAAHLAKAHADGTLLERFARAEASRPKVIDLTGGQTVPRVVTEEPARLLESTMRSLAAARFTFPSDCELANEMMAGFEWTIKTAMEQARAQDPQSGLTLPPAVRRNLRGARHRLTGERPEQRLLSPQDRTSHTRDLVLPAVVASPMGASSRSSRRYEELQVGDA